MLKLPIGQLSNQRAALAFCDYLKTKKIEAWMEHKESQYWVLINDEAAKDFACKELQHFLDNPSDSKYLDASWNEGSTSTSFSSMASQQSGNVSFKQFLERSGMMTRSLVMISVLVTLITSFGDNIDITKYLLIADITQYRGGLEDIFSGQIWRLITPIFLHFMVIHILFNMMWLWDLGGNVEKNQSPIFLLFFVVQS